MSLNFLLFQLSLNTIQIIKKENIFYIKKQVFSNMVVFIDSTGHLWVIYHLGRNIYEIDAFAFGNCCCTLTICSPTSSQCKCNQPSLRCRNKSKSIRATAGTLRMRKTTVQCGTFCDKRMHFQFNNIKGPRGPSETAVVAKGSVLKKKPLTKYG